MSRANYSVHYGYYQDRVRGFETFDEALEFYAGAENAILLGKDWCADVVDDEGESAVISDGLTESERERLEET